jgi:hypothetical protein
VETRSACIEGLKRQACAVGGDIVHGFQEGLKGEHTITSATIARKTDEWSDETVRTRRVDAPTASSDAPTASSSAPTASKNAPAGAVGFLFGESSTEAEGKCTDAGHERVSVRQPRGAFILVCASFEPTIAVRLHGVALLRS